MKNEIMIFKIEDTTITNEKTGEVQDYKIVNYLVRVGKDYEHFQCYVKAKFSNILEKHKLKFVQAEIEQRVVKNSIKLYLKSVNNESCR